MASSIESASHARCEYLEIVDPHSLESLTLVDRSRGARALIAVQFGVTRLIDNAALTTIKV
jgi:pantothenate synthetase